MDPKEAGVSVVGPGPGAPRPGAPSPGAPGPLARGERVRWTICGMLFFATSINYLDRQVLGVLAPTLQHSVGWTEAEYGYIIGAFQAAYAIGLLLAGRMMDRLGSRIGYAVIMAVWSVASVGHALARSVLGFGIARVLLGLGEAGNFPAAIKTTAEWFPQRERALATGILNSGSNLGAILAPALIPWITLRFGWQPAFLVTGFFGAVWLLWWWRWYREPADHPALSAGERAYIEQGAAAPGPLVPWLQLLKLRQTWAFSVAKFLTDPVWWFYLYWLPKFFDGRFHLGLSRLGLPLIVVYNVSAAGSISGGWLPARLSRAGWPLSRARFLAMLLCALLVLPMSIAGRVEHEWAAVALLSVAAAAHQGWSANLYTVVSDMFSQGEVGSVIGIGSMAGSVGGVLFSLAVGWVLQLTHSYTLLFTASASVYLLALLLLSALAPGLPKVARAESR